MRSSVLLPVYLVRFCAATGSPLLPHDPATIASCVEWYNNDEGKSCEYVRDYFTITPEQFHLWNPSIGLNCKPWYEYLSYCIVTKERNEEFSKTRLPIPTSQGLTTTLSTSKLGPSPTSWSARGCYADDPKLPTLEKLMSPESGDASLTIPKCQDACYHANLEFAGVKQGNQCWCSPYIAGEWSKNETDCNVPCAGDKSTFCGGQDTLNVFEAADMDLVWPPQSISMIVVDGSTKTTMAVQTETRESGAIRNIAIF